MSPIRHVFVARKEVNIIFSSFEMRWEFDTVSNDAKSLNVRKTLSRFELNSWKDYEVFNFFERPAEN